MKIDFNSGSISNPNNKLYYGDNLEVLRRYIESNSIDLCYIDPPFNSKRNYNQIYNNVGKEDKAQAQAFIDTWEWDTIADEGFHQILSNKNNVFTRQSIELIAGLTKILGKGSLSAYLVSMTLRIAEIYRILKPNGSFYFHCDPSSSHYLKLVLDAVFCGNKGEFQNEIIWSYKRYTAASNRFQRLHDVIFFYTKTDKGTFNDIREEYGEKSGKADSHYKQDDEGIWYRWQKRKGKEPYKVLLSPGRRSGDVWEIPIINASAKERLGYPTQKPEELLEKIINASTNEGDIVLDAYCGCGTSVSVAEKLKRKWIGIDITYQSISLILKRIEDTFGKKTVENIELNGIPKDIESAIALAHKKDDRVRKEFEKWAVLTYSNNKAMINEKKGADHGIDGIAFMMEAADSFKDILFSVKSGHANLSQFRDFCHVVKRDDAAIGMYITLEDPTKQMIVEAKKMGQYMNPLTEQTYEKVKIVTIEEILEGERLNVPTSVQILKKAEITKNKNQQTLFD